MNVNWSDVLLALKISGVGILVLLLVLAALAGIITLLTKFIKDKPEEEESEDHEEDASLPAIASKETSDLKKIAAIAIAIARAQSEIPSSMMNESSTMNAWGQYHLSRRLNLSQVVRRSK